MQLLPASAALPTGLSFEIPDLLLLQGWAEYHELRMVIELDCSIEGDEYEEMVALSSLATGSRRWMVWRSCNGIIAQPMVGRPMLFETLSEALDMLIPARN